MSDFNFTKASEEVVSDLFKIKNKWLPYWEKEARFYQTTEITFRDLGYLCMPTRPDRFDGNFEDLDLLTAVINLAAAVQRPDTGVKGKSESIMCSLVSGTAFGTLTLRCMNTIETEDKDWFAEVIDGSHRSRTCAYKWYQNLLRLPAGTFWKNENNLRHDVSGFNYEDLKNTYPKISEYIDNLDVTITMYYNISDEEQCDIFKSLNNSTHLNVWEFFNNRARNFMVEESRELVRPVQGVENRVHGYFKKAGWKMGRCYDQAFAAQVIKAIVEDGALVRPADANALEKFVTIYGSYDNSTKLQNSVWQQYKRQVKEHFDFMEQVIDHL